MFNCNTQWRYENAEVITWDRELYGEKMFYVWSEYDPGTSTTKTYSFSNSYKGTDGSNQTSNVSFSETTTDKTDELGQSIVEYCDGIGSDGFQYNTGSLYFQIQ